MITIPLLNGAVNAHQEFDKQLGDNFLQFTINYVTLAGPSWSVDISRAGVSLINGAMLEPNAIITDNYDADVTLDNLGVDNKLVWVSDDE